MGKIAYINRKFDRSSVELIQQAEAICSEYVHKGYQLTLRQIYYQFVSRGLMPNRQTEYKRLGSILSDARLAGAFDWDHMVDRTRTLRSLSHWDTPADIIQSAASSFRLDRWDDQDNYVEVWIEKDALVGVIERPCQALDVPYLSCRGYTSQSEVWNAGQRLARKMRQGKSVHIIHLGDHDPSGIDMSRDIEERLNLFALKHTDTDDPVNVHRIALNMEQVEQYNPPPNPAKLTDSRAVDYINKYGVDSWELDALNPDIIGDLIRESVEYLIQQKRWDAVEIAEEEGRRELDRAADNWPEVASLTDAFDADGLESLRANASRVEAYLKATAEDGPYAMYVGIDDVRNVLLDSGDKFFGIESYDRWKFEDAVNKAMKEIERFTI